MLTPTITGNYTDSNNYQWVYYGDDTVSTLFYIIPQPQWAMDSGQPELQIVEYATDDPSTNGSGVVTFTVELGVPSAVTTAITQQIQSSLNVSNPQFGSLGYNPSGQAFLTFTASGETTTYAAPASAFGSNQATFSLQLSADELTSFVTAMNTAGSTYQVMYDLTVPARLPAVNATLSFNSAIAYQYQVTQPTQSNWGSSTPGSVAEQLQASGSSTVNVVWGVANPPQSLQEAVTNWANSTLADLVNAAVQAQMQIQGLSSDESFSINEVASFTSTYNASQVVDWFLQPQVQLPSLNTLGLQASTFTGTANEQQQVMTVQVAMPFSAESSTLPPTSEFQQVLVESVTVTVSYPGLPQAQSSASFTTSTSATFTAPYNTTQGADWSLTYEVTYAGGQPAVTGSVSGIDTGTYQLDIAAMGYLSVTFDATNVFAVSASNPVANQPTSVVINLQYVNSDGTGNFINQQATIAQPAGTGQSNLQATITSLNTVPINDPYSYTVTYVYPNLNYTAPAQTNQTGFNQTIYPTTAVQPTNIILAYDQSSGQAPIVNSTVNVWYDSQPSVPNAPQQPSQGSPTQFILTPTSSSGWSYASDTFFGLASAGQPIWYSASINALSGAVDIPATMLNNETPSIMAMPNQEYFTVEVDPTAITWANNLAEVVVTVTPVTGPVNPQPTQLVFPSGETVPQYVTWSITQNTTTGQFPAVSYTWSATYTVPGQTPKTTPVVTVTPASPSPLLISLPPTAS
jgi:hypothetical protein